MSRILFVTAVVVVALVLLAAVATAAPYLHWQPFKLVMFSALDAGGTAANRYSVALIEDVQTPAVCMAVVTDSATGQFTATSIPAEACALRRGR